MKIIEAYSGIKDLLRQFSNSILSSEILTKEYFEEEKRNLF